MENLPGETPRAFNVPGVVVGLIAAMVVVHLFRLYGPISDDLIIYYFAFIPARLSDGIAVDGDLLDLGARYWSLLTYAFLHADWLHLAMNSFWMLAFRQPGGEAPYDDRLSSLERRRRHCRCAGLLRFSSWSKRSARRGVGGGFRASRGSGALHVHVASANWLAGA